MMLGQLRSAPNLLTLLRLIFIPFVVVAIQQQKCRVTALLNGADMVVGV